MAEAMTLRPVRMLEVVSRIASHAEALHHSNRSKVRRNGERNDFAYSNSLEPVCERSPSSFCCETAIPIGTVETPTDFDRRHEGSIERGDGQADKANEVGLASNFNRPESVGELAEITLNPINGDIGLLPTKHIREVLHNYWIAVEKSERLSIASPPLPQD